MDIVDLIYDRDVTDLIHEMPAIKSIQLGII